MGQKVSEKLVQLRKNKNLTQKQLAAKLNVSSQLISKWETGQATPSLDYAVEICNLFEISMDQFVGKNKEKQQKKENKESKVKKENKFFVTLKKLKWCFYAFAGLVGTGLVALLLVFGIIPAACKDRYIAEVEASFEQYFAGDSFNVYIESSTEGNVSFKQIYQGYVDENGVTFYAKGESGNKTVINGEIYQGNYRAEYASSAATAKDLFVEEVGSMTEDAGFEISDIRHIRKTGYGYYVEIHSQEIKDMGRENGFAVSDMKGNFFVKNGQFERAELSVFMFNWETKAGVVIKSSIECKKEKPVIAAPEEYVPYKAPAAVSKEEFVKSIYADKAVEKISLPSTTSAESLQQAFRNEDYSIYGDNVWIFYSDYPYKHLKAYSVSDFEEVKDVDLSTYSVLEHFFWKEYLIFWDSSTIYKVSLGSGEISVINSGSSITLSSDYRLYNNEYLFAVGRYSSEYLYFYSINLNSNDTKMVKMSIYSIFDAGYYYKDNFVYAIYHGEYLDSADKIYKIDLLQGSKQQVGDAEPKIEKIEYVTDDGDVLFSIEDGVYIQSATTDKQYVKGSNANGVFFTPVGGGEIITTYKTPSGTVGGNGVNTITHSHDNFVSSIDADLLYEAATGERYYKGKSVIYKKCDCGVFLPVASIPKIALQNQYSNATPIFAYCDGENLFTVVRGSFDFKAYIAVYDIDNLLKPYVITETVYSSAVYEDGKISFEFVNMGETAVVVLDEEFFILK